MPGCPYIGMLSIRCPVGTVAQPARVKTSANTNRDFDAKMVFFIPLDPRYSAWRKSVDKGGPIYLLPRRSRPPESATRALHLFDAVEVLAELLLGLAGGEQSC